MYLFIRKIRFKYQLTARQNRHARRRVRWDQFFDVKIGFVFIFSQLKFNAPRSPCYESCERFGYKKITTEGLYLVNKYAHENSLNLLAGYRLKKSKFTKPQTPSFCRFFCMPTLWSNLYSMLAKSTVVCQNQ